MSKKEDSTDKYLEDVEDGSARPLHEFPEVMGNGEEDTTGGTFGPVQEFMWFIGDESFRVPEKGVSLKQVHTKVEEYTGETGFSLWAKETDLTEFGGLAQLAGSDGWCRLPRSGLRLTHVAFDGIQLVVAEGRPGEVEEQVEEPDQDPRLHTKKDAKGGGRHAANNMKAVCKF